MALTNLTSPDLLEAVGSRCYWLASENPILFTYQRKDLAIISIQNMGTIRVNVASVPSEAAVGQQVYIFNNGYKGQTTIKSIGVGYIELNMIYIGASTGGYLNLTEARNNYHMDLNLYQVQPSGNVFIGNYRYYDNPTGVVTVDLQDAVNSQLSINEKGYNYNLPSDDDPGRSIAFAFEYREGWRMTGGNPFTYGTLSDTYYAVKGTKQIGERWGQNLRRYMLDTATDPIFEEYIAHFMTKFERPVFFEGLPFSLSFLFTEHIVDAQNNINRHIQLKDVNAQNIGGEVVDSIQYQFEPSISRLRMDTGNASSIFTSNVHSFEVWLEEGSPVELTGGGYGTGIGGDGASTDYFAEDYDENWGT